MTDQTDYPDLIHPPPFPHLLPPNFTRLERALAEQTGRIDNVIPVPIDRLLDADLCPTSYLPWLAWHLGLDLWDWRWNELKRREVIRQAIKFARAKGTAKGVRMAVGIMGCNVTQIVTPPQGFFASRDLTKAEWDGWIHQMPELRIKLTEGHGVADPDEWFTDNDPPPLSGAPLSLAWAIYSWSGTNWVFAVEYTTQSQADTVCAALGGWPNHVVAKGPPHTPPSPPYSPAGSKFGFVAPDIPDTPTPPALQQWGVYLLTATAGGALYWLPESKHATQALADQHGELLSGEHIVARCLVQELPPPTLPLGGSFIGLDDGWVLHGRRVILRWHGVDTPMQVATKATIKHEGKSVEVERISVNGRCTLGFICDADVVDDHYVCAAEVPTKLVSVRLDDTYIHESSLLGLTMIRPGMEVIDPRYERDSDVGYGDSLLFASDWFVDDQSYVEREYADDMLADRIYMLDESVAVPMNYGSSFAGVDRVGMPAFTAELMIDLLTKEPNQGWFVDADDNFIEQAFVLPETDTLDRIDRSCRAVVAAKSFRDVILADFAPRRQIEPFDTITDQTTAGDWVPAPL